MDLNTLFHRTVECWATRVNAVTHDQWNDPTPCAGWTVRELVGHVVGEDRWTVPLTEGRTIEEIGDTLGLKANAAKHSIFRAVRKMRLALEPLVGSGKEPEGEKCI